MPHAGLPTGETAPRETAPRPPAASPESRLRVGLVGTACWPVVGGMEVYLHRLAHALADAGHDVRIATRYVGARPDGMRGALPGGEPPRTYTDGAVTTHVVGPRGRAGRALLRPVYRLHFYDATRPLARALQQAALGPPLAAALAGCDVVHYSGTGQEFLGFAALREARRASAAFVVTPHTHAGAWGDGPLDLALYRQADAVVALTEDERARLTAAGLEPARVPVIGHGVSVAGTGDGARFRAAHGLPPEAPIVLFVGRKATYKGYPLLLSAMPALWEAHPEARLVLVGPHETGADAPAAVRADPRVLDLGVVTDAEREDAYAACDVFALPSAAEAFGLVYLEAWAYGKPVVALRIPTMEELVERTGGGLLVDWDADEVAATLARLLADAPLRARLGAAGRAGAARRTWADVAADVATAYAAACGHPAKGAPTPAPPYATGGGRDD